MPTISNDVISVLGNSTVTEGPDGLLLTLNGQLERKLYIKTNQVLESIGFEWNKKRKLHISTTANLAQFEDMITSGNWVNQQKELQFFPTPADIAAKMVKSITWHPGMTVLEPSCGTGNLLTALPNMSLKVTAMDIHKPFIESTSALCATMDTTNTYEFLCQDFTTYDNGDKLFDAIIMNPPFTKNQDVKHFFRAFDMLKVGGQLACILSSGAYNHSSCINIRKQFTNFVDGLGEQLYNGSIGTMEKLDAGTFSDSGTEVSTILVYAKKGSSQW